MRAGHFVLFLLEYFLFSRGGAFRKRYSNSIINELAKCLDNKGQMEALILDFRRPSILPA